MDLVLLGGNVLTMDGRDSRAEAVAVNGSKLEAVGSNAEVSKLIGPDTEVVHLAGRTVIPGFVDPHNHFSLTTFQPVSVNCSVPPHNSVQAGIPQIKPTFLGIAPSGIPSNIIPHSKGIKCGLIRSNSPFSYSNHRPAKPKIPKPLVYAQVSPLGTSFATP